MMDENWCKKRSKNIISVRPTSVAILQKPEHVRVGEEYALACQALGSKPPAEIVWLKNGLEVDKDKVSVSIRPFRVRVRSHYVTKPCDIGLMTV